LTEIKAYDAEINDKWSDKGMGLSNGMMGLGNIALIKKTPFFTLPGKHFGQGGLSVRSSSNSQSGSHVTNTRSFESPKLHKQLRSNKEYSKEQ